MKPTGNDVCIEIHNLSFQYPRGEEPVLKGIDLQIRKGEFVLLTGPTGSGKTTLALSLNGIIPHLIEGEMSGEVIVDGLDTREHEIHEMASQIGLVFQNPEDQLFSLKVEDEIAFGVENMGYAREEIIRRVEDAIRKTGLEDRRSYSIFHLSGGQKQKVAIAGNLANSPEIFVLDSPTADLDPISSREVVHTLIDLRRQEPGKTFVLIDSNLSNGINLADRVIAIDKGKILLDTSPIDLIQNHYDELIRLGIRLPEHLHLLHSLIDLLPALNESMLQEEEVIRLAQNLRHEGQISASSDSSLPLNKPSDALPVVQFEDVSFQYKNGPVILDHFNLKIEAGEWLAIIGENGTGKSTLLKLISGLIKPQSGRVITAGQDTSLKRLEELTSRIGYLFQNPDHQLFLSSVEEEIAFGPRRCGLPEEQVQERLTEALKAVGLEGYRKAHPFMLSRGQRQRLAVATVLAAGPQLLLLDEPTTGQDQIALDSLMDLTRRLIRNSGCSVVMVTHDMELVAKYASRVIVLNQGRALLDGSPLNVFKTGSDILAKAKLFPPFRIRMEFLLDRPEDQAHRNLVLLGENAYLSA